MGAKEVGQGPLLPVMPALSNAIFDAVGARVEQVPIHPHMVLAALQAGRRGGEARFGPRAFPDYDFGQPLDVPTPAEGGDGRSLNDERSRLHRMAADTGTMTTREEALKDHRGSLTTD
jgi:hypothetical protein